MNCTSWACMHATEGRGATNKEPGSAAVKALWLSSQGKNVLRKEPMSREVEETDTFHFHEQFSSKLYKLKIGTITAQKESEPEKLETRQKVRPAQHHGHTFYSFFYGFVSLRLGGSPEGLRHVSRCQAGAPCKLLQQCMEAWAWLRQHQCRWRRIENPWWRRQLCAS